MHAAAESGSHADRWILLIHHLPPKPDYLRVKVRRQLSRIGAVALKNSVYLMPNSDEALEDVEWLRRMIVDEGGEAVVCTAMLLDGVTDQEVQAMFTAQVDEEYRRIAQAAAAALAAPTDGDLRRLERSLADTGARDFFRSAGATGARRAIAALERALSPRGPTPPGPARATRVKAPRGATWVTRRGVFIDRIASAWLIQRFVDPKAVFKFVPPKGYRPKAGEVRFDMFRGEFNCDADRCTFQVLVQHFAPGDAALAGIGEIVHDVDVQDDTFGRAEAAGVATLIRGIVESHHEDAQRIDAGLPLFDGLYAALRA